jgi:hypothetical protein
MNAHPFPDLRLWAKSGILSFLLLVAAPAQAIIIFYDSPIPIPLDGNGVYLNLFSNATTGSEPGSFDTAPWINPFQGGVYVATSALICPVIVGADQIVNLASGTMIDATQTYAPPAPSGSASHMGGSAGQFRPNTPGYIGFKMQASPTSDTYYGWMSVSFNNTGSGSILSYAYESTAGTGIVAGATAVPEPSRAVLLLLASVGLLLRRKRE